MEAELLDSPEEREPVGSSKNRRDFGTCQVQPLFSSTGALYVLIVHYTYMNDKQTLKIELLSQWKLEAEFRNILQYVGYTRQT